LRFVLSFSPSLSWVANAKFYRWTKQMVRIRSITQDVHSLFLDFHHSKYDNFLFFFLGWQIPNLITGLRPQLNTLFAEFPLRFVPKCSSESQNQEADPKRVFPAPPLNSLVEPSWEHPFWNFLDVFIRKVNQTLEQNRHGHCSFFKRGTVRVSSSSINSCIYFWGQILTSLRSNIIVHVWTRAPWRSHQTMFSQSKGAFWISVSKCSVCMHIWA